MTPSTTRTTATTPTRANSSVVVACEGVLVLLLVVEVLEEAVAEVELVVMELDDVVVVIVGASKTYVAASVELADNCRVLEDDMVPSPHLEKARVLPFASFTVCGSVKL